MDTVGQRLRHRHIIQDRKTEIFIAIIIFIIGSLLLFDAFDARGKEVPWPIRKLTPW